MSDDVSDQDLYLPAGSTAVVKKAADLTSFGTLVLADPQAVPAGVYARTWLEARGVWASTLESAREDAAGREALAERLQRLDAMIAAQGIPAP